MPEIDPITGLPKELGTFENLAKERQKVTVSTTKKKFGKQYTIVEGVNEHEIDLKDLARKLKEQFACGGTAKDGVIELQGNHTKAIKGVLVKLGFAPDTIDVTMPKPSFRKRR
ncbi:stress response translation initiation inhibitor YciH [Candidatus Woesearchaeota archaeon]|nr:stress response translation initiation inhibitor YciH [Candidatus Woesearchaeota archaeon]